MVKMQQTLTPHFRTNESRAKCPTQNKEILKELEEQEASIRTILADNEDVWEIKILK
jgi:hypothetical protein